MDKFIEINGKKYMQVEDKTDSFKSNRYLVDDAYAIFMLFLFFSGLSLFLVSIVYNTNWDKAFILGCMTVGVVLMLPLFVSIYSALQILFKSGEAIEDGKR